MPRWEVHISFGLMAFIVLAAGMLLGLGSYDILSIDGGLLIRIGIVFLLGGGGLIIASVLPDVDGKGRIKWIIGPVVGAMIFIPPLIGSLRSGGPASGMDFIAGWGSLLFLAGTIGAYLFLLVPKKHRGIWHRSFTGLLLGFIWGSYVCFTASTTPTQSILVGSMGSLGYGWHLALDGRLV